MKIIKYFLEAILIYTFFIIIKIIGPKISKKIFAFIFRKIGPVIRSNSIIENNLKIINEGKKANNVKKITSNMWSNYGMIFVEYIFLKNYRKKNSHISIKGLDILKKIASEKKSVIFVSGHFANFELMSMEITKAGVDLATIYRPLNNIFLNPFMEYVRRKHVCQNQIKKGILGIRHSVGYLKRNHSIALMIDQRVSEGRKIPLFKKNALTTTLPAQLALKFKCAIIPIYIRRIDLDSFEMIVEDPINTTNFDYEEKNKVEISIKLNKILEEMIKKDPSQWILTHNRWK